MGFGRPRVSGAGRHVHRFCWHAFLRVRVGAYTDRSAVQSVGSAVTVGTSYSAAMAFQQVASTGGSLQIGIQWYTSGGTLISTSTGTAGANVGTGGTGSVSVTASAPATAATAKIILTKGFDTSQYNVDAINFAPAAQGTAYHDGDSGSGWAWAGTAGNSTSQNSSAAADAGTSVVTQCVSRAAFI